MIRKMFAVFGIVLFASTLAFSGYADQWARCEYLPGRMIVNFDESIGLRVPRALDSEIIEIGIPPLDELFSEFEVSSARRLVPDRAPDRMPVQPDIYRLYVLTFPDHYSVLDVVDQFALSPYVSVVEPDLIYHMYRTPNDALWNNQWDKRLCRGEVCWDVATGLSSIIVAGIDSGVQWNHPDLRGILWVNPIEDIDADGVIEETYPGERGDADGSDNDVNGYIDDLIGWDFIESMSNCDTGEDCDNLQDNNMFGLNDHGSHVAGIMAAQGNNGIGVCGWVWNGTLMALRAGYQRSDGEGLMPQSATVPAIYYAAFNGANILNMSYGGTGFSATAQSAMNYAWNNGAMLFAASGNEGLSSPPHYPAAYEHVIAVNMTDNNDVLDTYSNRGTWTDLCAPGSSPGIMSTSNNSNYASYEGTSMASPNAAGIAALIWGIFPYMTNEEIETILFDTAIDITEENSDIPPSHLGHGRVDAQAALASLYPRMIVEGFSISDAGGGDGDGRLEAGESCDLVLTCTNETGWSPVAGVTATVWTNEPNLTVTNETFSLGDLNPGQTADNSGDPVVLTASGFQGAFWGTIHVTFQAPSGYSISTEFTLRVGRGYVLVVDDDGVMEYQQFYTIPTEDLGLMPDVWSSSLDGDVTVSEMNQYQAVIWSCGDESENTLTAADQAALSSYLDGGGNLLVVGQSIDEDISGTSFYSDYLHAQHVDGVGNRQLDGIGGNPISDGMELLLLGGGCGGNGSVSPSLISPINGAQAVFDYTDEGIGAVMYSGAYKVVYFSCALEAACGMGGTTHHAAVIESILSWMEVSDVPEPGPSAFVPSAVRLNGNYPNPFNPSTTISFDLNVRSHVLLTVYNVAGREVATLVDQPLAAGNHLVPFDGSGLASGMYLVRLSAAGQTMSSKMLLMK